MSSFIFLNNIEDDSGIFQWFWREFHVEFRDIRCSSDGNTTEIQDIFKKSPGEAIDFLNLFQRTLPNRTIEEWKLFYTNNPLIGNDIEIEFIIYPVHVDEQGEKHNEGYRQQRKECSRQEYGKCRMKYHHEYSYRNEDKNISTRIQEGNPMAVEYVFDVFPGSQVTDVKVYWYHEKSVKE